MLQVLLYLPVSLLMFIIEHDFKCFIMLDLYLDDAVQSILGHVNSFIVLL